MELQISANDNNNGNGNGDGNYSDDGKIDLLYSNVSKRIRKLTVDVSSSW